MIRYRLGRTETARVAEVEHVSEMHREEMHVTRAAPRYHGARTTALPPCRCTCRVFWGRPIRLGSINGRFFVVAVSGS